MKVTLGGIVSARGQSNPCFKGVHESIRSVMVSMRTNLHMRVDYAQRVSVECHASSIHGCVMYLLLSQKGDHHYGSLSGEKGLLI